jgi:hypothetical protein
MIVAPYRLIPAHSSGSTSSAAPGKTKWAWSVNGVGSGLISTTVAPAYSASKGRNAAGYTTGYALAPARALHPGFFLVHHEALALNDVPDAREQVGGLGDRRAVGAEREIVGVTGVCEAELFGQPGEARRLLSAGLVQAPCGRPRGPVATT